MDLLIPPEKILDNFSGRNKFDRNLLIEILALPHANKILSQSRRTPQQGYQSASHFLSVKSREQIPGTHPNPELLQFTLQLPRLNCGAATARERTGGRILSRQNRECQKLGRLETEISVPRK